MSSLMIAAELASALDGRLVFERQISHLWQLPAEYDLKRSLMQDSWNYETHGRDEKNYLKWVDEIHTSESFREKYSNKIIDSSICGMDRKIIKLGKCTNQALTTYAKCFDRIQDLTVNMPIYYNIFRKPTQLMVDHLKRIRERLSLPQLEPGLEPNPGAWGLHTPGYYLFALHFRMIPLGFEPLSVMLNEGDSLRRKLEDLRNFWDTATRLAQRAREIADCRNETLLIYFATDDAENLRKKAAKKLGKIGRVVFGLADDEVGHMRAQWTPQAMKEVDEKRAAVLEKKRAAKAAKACSAHDAGEGRCERPSGIEHKINVVRPARGEEVAQKHNDMSLVEWWILANAQARRKGRGGERGAARCGARTAGGN